MNASLRHSLEMLDAALRLTHPECHPPERQELAKRVMQDLLALKPFVFPAAVKTICPTAGTHKATCAACGVKVTSKCKDPIAPVM